MYLTRATVLQLATLMLRLCHFKQVDCMLLLSVPSLSKPFGDCTRLHNNSVSHLLRAEDECLRSLLCLNISGSHPFHPKCIS